MTRESMIKVLRYKAEHIKTRIKPEFFLEVADALEQQPCEDTINRSETIKYLNTNMAWYDEDGEIADSDEKLKAITDLINGVPSAQPKYNASEWCHDCKEYDHEKHCCPRFNRVIRNTVEEVKKPKTGLDRK